MNTKDLECRLAQAQLARYVAGEELAAELVADLEAHIAECADCHAAVEARRRILGQRLFRGEGFASQAPAESSVAPVVEPYAVVEMPAQPSERKSRLPAWMEGVLPVGSGMASGGVARKWRPLALSLLLSGVLIAMTAMAKNPNALFGERVAPTPGKGTAAAPPVGAQDRASTPPTSRSNDRPATHPSQGPNEANPSTATVAPGAASGGSTIGSPPPNRTDPSLPANQARADEAHRSAANARPATERVGAPPRQGRQARPTSASGPVPNPARRRTRAQDEVGSIRVYDSEGNLIRP